MAAKVTTLDKTHFAEVERIGILLKNRRTSAAASAAATLAGVKGPDDLPLRPEASRVIVFVVGTLPRSSQDLLDLSVSALPRNWSP